MVRAILTESATRRSPGGDSVRIAGESDEAVSTSTQFRITSMTKMVATTAALQQVEKGTLDLDAPVEAYCPEFADLQVLDGFDGETPRMRPPASKATVKQLVTHTSGLGYWFWNAELVRWEAATGTPNVLDAGRRENAVTIHVRSEDGGWTSAGEILNQEPDWWAGRHGLHSTPRDYIRFEQALLRGGEPTGPVAGTRELTEAMFRIVPRRSSRLGRAARVIQTALNRLRADGLSARRREPSR